MCRRFDSKDTVSIPTLKSTSLSSGVFAVDNNDFLLTSFKTSRLFLKLTLVVLVMFPVFISSWEFSSFCRLLLTCWIIRSIISFLFNWLLRSMFRLQIVTAGNSRDCKIMKSLLRQRLLTWAVIERDGMKKLRVNYSGLVFIRLPCPLTTHGLLETKAQQEAPAVQYPGAKFDSRTQRHMWVGFLLCCTRDFSPGTPKIAKLQNVYCKHFIT